MESSQLLRFHSFEWNNLDVADFFLGGFGITLLLPSGIISILSGITLILPTVGGFDKIS